LPEVGGLSLRERLLRQLGCLDRMEDIVVASPTSPPVPSSPWVRAPVRHLTLDSGDHDWWPALREAGDRLPESFIVAGGDLVVDQRLLKWLAEQTGDVLVSSGAGGEILGHLRRDTLRSAASPADVPVISIDSFPTYSREQRGEVPVHLLRVASEHDAEHAWRALLEHVDKRTKDLPAVLFDPPVENFIVRRLAPTRVTPNQVTVFTTVLGFFVAWLFLRGWLLTGVLLAIAVEVLDGVDGKLARLKHMTSKLGELEHVLDFFYENSWWLALGAGFAARGEPWAWPAALMLCAADLADNFAYLFFARRVAGAQDGGAPPRSDNLDEATPLLSRFRLIAGRRNIYIWMMLPFAFLGGGATAFAIVVAWAVVTAATHWYLAATTLPRQ
jgi:phosphatidylglycerophosphate synthase